MLAKPRATAFSTSDSMTAISSSVILGLLATTDALLVASRARPTVPAPFGRRRSCVHMGSSIDVSDLGVTMEDLKAPLPMESGVEVETSGSESVSRVSLNDGCRWTETASEVEAGLTIPGLLGQPAGCLAVELTETTATITAFGTAVWSCVLRGTVDPSQTKVAISSEGMQPVVAVAMTKTPGSGRWGGLIKQIGEDSLLE